MQQTTRRIALIALLPLCWLSSAVQADMLTALKAYELKDYPSAHSEFNALLAVGNESAVFNLAVMAYKGQGEPADPVKAAALFALAASLGHSDGAELHATIKADLSPPQQQQSAALQQLLAKQVLVPPTTDSASATSTPNEPAGTPEPIPLSRNEPMYPSAAMRNNISGFVAANLLLSRQGKVLLVAPMVSFPQQTFDEQMKKTALSWQYTEAATPAVVGLTVSWSLMQNGAMSQRKFEGILAKEKLWEFAAFGSPQHQFTLAVILEQLAQSSGRALRADPALADQLGKFPTTLFKRFKQIKPVDSLPLTGPLSELVRIDADGKIAEVLTPHNPAQAKQLIGLPLRNNDRDGREFLLTVFQQQQLLTPVLRVPRTLTAEYWYDQAARGGERDAQRLLAQQGKPGWQQYLLQQRDPITLAWHGAKLATQGDTAQGYRLLDEAITLGYREGVALKTALQQLLQPNAAQSSAVANEPRRLSGR